MFTTISADNNCLLLKAFHQPSGEAKRRFDLKLDQTHLGDRVFQMSIGIDSILFRILSCSSTFHSHHKSLI